MKLAALIAVVLAAASFAACGSNGGSSTRPAGRSSAVRDVSDVRDVNQLRTLFNAQSGEPRLIVLASPT